MRDFKRRLSGNSRHVCGKYDPICKIKHQLEGDFKSQWGGHDIKLLIKVLLKAMKGGGQRTRMEKERVAGCHLNSKIS